MSEGGRSYANGSQVYNFDGGGEVWEGCESWRIMTMFVTWSERRLERDPSMQDTPHL